MESDREGRVRDDPRVLNWGKVGGGGCQWQLGNAGGASVWYYVSLGHSRLEGLVGCSKETVQDVK